MQAACKGSTDVCLKSHNLHRKPTSQRHYNNYIQVLSGHNRLINEKDEHLRGYIYHNAGAGTSDYIWTKSCFVFLRNHPNEVTLEILTSRKPYDSH